MKAEETKTKHLYNKTPSPQPHCAMKVNIQVSHNYLSEVSNTKEKLQSTGYI